MQYSFDDRLRPPRPRGHHRVAAGEYGNRGLLALPDIGASGADLQSCRFDQIHDLRKTREGLTIPSQHIVIAQPL
jgi:hypothetical protein